MIPEWMTPEQHQEILYGVHYSGLDASLVNMPFYKRPARFENIVIIPRMGRLIAQIDGVDLDEIFYSRNM